MTYFQCNGTLKPIQMLLIFKIYYLKFELLLSSFVWLKLNLDSKDQQQLSSAKNNRNQSHATITINRTAIARELEAFEHLSKHRTHVSHSGTNN